MNTWQWRSHTNQSCGWDSFWTRWGYHLLMRSLRFFWRTTRQPIVYPRGTLLLQKINICTLQTAVVFCQNWEVMALVVSAAVGLDLVWDLIYWSSCSPHNLWVNEKEEMLDVSCTSSYLQSRSRWSYANLDLSESFRWRRTGTVLPGKTDAKKTSGNHYQYVRYTCPNEEKESDGVKNTFWLPSIARVTARKH